METPSIPKSIGSKTSDSIVKVQSKYSCKSHNELLLKNEPFPKHERRAVQHRIHSKQIKQWSKSTKEHEKQSDKENK